MSWMGKGPRRVRGQHEEAAGVWRSLTVMCGLAVVLAVGVVACGSDDDEASESTVASASSDSIAIDATTTTTISGDSSSSVADATTTTEAPMSTMEPGDITQTVPTVVVDTAAPVAVDDTASFSNEVSASISNVADVETESQTPGEVGGPGVALTIEIDNGSAESIDVGNVIVDLVDSTGASATPIGTGSTPFSGAIAAGDSASGVYVFTIDEAVRGDVTIRISYSADEPIVLFTGNIA